MSAWLADMEAARLVRVVASAQPGEYVIAVGEWGQVESQILSLAGAECNAASLRRDFANALRTAFAEGERAGLGSGCAK